MNDIDKCIHQLAAYVAENFKRNWVIAKKQSLALRFYRFWLSNGNEPLILKNLVQDSGAATILLDNFLSALADHWVHPPLRSEISNGHLRNLIGGQKVFSWRSKIRGLSHRF